MPVALQFVVMGVSGCGKSSIGEALAEQFEMDFTEGDALHSTDGVEKCLVELPSLTMIAGHSLSHW